MNYLRRERVTLKVRLLETDYSGLECLKEAKHCISLRRIPQSPHIPTNKMDYFRHHKDI